MVLQQKFMVVQNTLLLSKIALVNKDAKFTDLASLFYDRSLILLQTILDAKHHLDPAKFSLHD